MENEKLSVVYREEIALMMFGFGDNSQPNPETVKLVECVALKQIRDMIYEASKLASMRRLKVINPEDIIFLLRHEKHKMHRFLKLLSLKAKYTSLFNRNPLTMNVNLDPEGKQRKNSIMEFIELIDETGELSNVQEYDINKEERLLRTERLSDALNEKKYQEFSAARRASFINLLNKKKKASFQIWLDPKQEFNISPSSYEILAHLAFGIVGHIVDMALIIRQDNRRDSNDPEKLISVDHYNSTMFNVPRVSRYEAPKDYNFTKIQASQSPLTTDEVREAMRRCYTPQTGFLKFSNKSMTAKRKFFCT